MPFSIPLLILPISGTSSNANTCEKSFLALPYIISHYMAVPHPLLFPYSPHNSKLRRGMECVLFNSVSLAVPNVTLSVH